MSPFSQGQSLPLIEIQFQMRLIQLVPNGKWHPQQRPGFFRLEVEAFRRSEVGVHRDSGAKDLDKPCARAEPSNQGHQKGVRWLVAGA